jgi:hypothetical protein
MVSATTSLSFAAVTALAASGINAHGTLSKPGLTFTGTGYGGNYQSNIPMDSLTAQSGDSFSNYPDYSANANAFSRALQASEYKSLKEFIYTKQDMSQGRFNMPKTAECGFTDPVSGTVQELPDEAEWYGGKMIHDGPCEIWCDDEAVVPFTADCAVTYPEGKFAYDKTACENKSRLTMYWLGTLLEWQVYIDCAKIGENGSAASNDSSALASAATSGASSFTNTTSSSSNITEVPAGTVVAEV